MRRQRKSRELLGKRRRCARAWLVPQLHPVLFSFPCWGNFLPVSDLLQKREWYCSFFVAPTLNEFMLIKKQHSGMPMWQNRRILMFMQVGAEIAVQSQPRAVIYLLLSFQGLLCPSSVRGLSAPDVDTWSDEILLTLFFFLLSPGWHVVHNTYSWACELSYS